MDRRHRGRSTPATRCWALLSAGSYASDHVLPRGGLSADGSSAARKPFASSEVPLLLEQTYVTAPPLLQTYLERLESLVALRKALITDGDHIQCGV